MAIGACSHGTVKTGKSGKTGKGWLLGVEGVKKDQLLCKYYSVLEFGRASCVFCADVDLVTAFRHHSVVTLIGIGHWLRFSGVAIFVKTLFTQKYDSDFATCQCHSLFYQS
jgi:hypothetical protein